MVSNVNAIGCKFICSPPLHLPVFQKDNIEKEGWLKKTSKHIKTNRRRWMVLVKGDPGYLISFKNEREYFEPTEVFEITENTVAEFGEDLKQFVLKTLVRKKAKKRTFSCDSVNVAEEWVKEINVSLNYARRARILQSFKELQKLDGSVNLTKKGPGVLGEDYLEVVTREAMIDWIKIGESLYSV